MAHRDHHRGDDHDPWNDEHDQIVAAMDDAEADAYIEDFYAFQQEVERRAHDMRVADAARAKVAAERLGEMPAFDAGSLAEILARDPEPSHRVEGLIPAGASTLIVAARKTGKTTLTLNLARTLIEGGDFLGRFATKPAQGNVAILNYEVTGAMLGRWADEAGIAHDRFFTVNLRGRRNPFSHEEDRAALAEWLRERDVETLIVDPFTRAYIGKNQNDAAEVGAFLSELDRFSRTEVGAADLILTAHAGWEGERTRGSSELEGWPDVIVTMTRDKDDDQVRYLAAEGRDVLIEEDRLDFDAERRALRLAGAGSRKVAAHTRKVEVLLWPVLDEVKAEEGLSGYKIEQRLKTKGFAFQRGDAQQAANMAVDKGWLTSAPGIRNSTCYYLSGADLPDLPAPSPRDGQTTFPTSLKGREVVEEGEEPSSTPGRSTTTGCRICGGDGGKTELGTRGLCVDCELKDAAR